VLIGEFKMKKLWFGLIFIGLFLVGCQTTPVNSFIVNQSSYNLIIGDEVSLDITIIGEQSLVIVNENPDIVEVNLLQVKALSAGEAIILIQMEGTDLSFAIDMTVQMPPVYQIDGLRDTYVNEQTNYSLYVDNVLVEDVLWSVDDALKASITSEGVLTALQSGDVVLQAIVDEEVVASITITLQPEVIPDFEFVTEGLALVEEVRILTLSVSDVAVHWSSTDPEIATVDQTGQVQFVGSGVVTIRVEATNNPLIYFEQSFHVLEAYNYSVELIIVDPSIAEVVNENVFYYDDIDYHRGVNVFSTITEAIDACQEDSVVMLNAGVYTEDFSLTKSNMRLVGPNQDIDPLTQERVLEAVLVGNVRISDKVEHITFNGLSFTEDATVLLEGQTDFFTFVNNRVYETTPTTVNWTEQSTYFTGFLTFRSGGKNSNQVVIENNVFTTLGDVGINISNMNTIKVIHNEFSDFTRDAIRMSNGIVGASSQWLFMNNTFDNGAYNGIYFRTYGSNSEFIENVISIVDNTFTEVGKTSVAFSGAISFRNYQEGLTSINIGYNKFESCSNYIMLRNNAVTSNQGNFSAFVNYNAFIGLPQTYFLHNKNGSDTISTNPSIIQMSYNFYGLSETTPISIDEHQTKFMGIASSLTIATMDVLKAIPHVYGSNLVHIDNTPTILSSTGVGYQSSNEAIFSVSGEGVITPHQEGTAILTVSKGSYQTVFPIIVGKSLNVDYIYLLLQTAFQEEGYVEGYNNDTKFGTWYGIPNGAWCAMFVSWCSNEVGISTAIIPKYASVSAGMAWFQERGLFEYKETYVPKAGDLIFFKSDGASHTGIVISCDGTTVYTIEGNTSDMVAKRSYNLMYSKITGYGLPEYPIFEGDPFVFDISGATDGAGHSTR